MATEVPDLVLVGGGLANGLIAWRLASIRPDVRFLLLEGGARLGGNHTWSFHDGDLAPGEHGWIGDLVDHRWEGYDVRFPGLSRHLPHGYSSLTSATFHDWLMSRLGERVRLGTAVAEVTPRSVRLVSGETLRAGAVIDGRGARRSQHMSNRCQAFLGQEVQLQHGHGLSAPLIMDATVPQHEGYRFVYVLPLSEHRLLIEDTYYVDGASLDENALRARIAAYLASNRWGGAQVLREEHGVLPITLAGNISAFWDEHAGVPRSGLAAGLFHPATGYSLPDAVRLADLICAQSNLSAPALFAVIRAHAEDLWRRRRFYRLLNRMLFLAGAPDQRYRVMRRFYGLPEALIRRFYAGETSSADKMRILSGKPPVPLLGALRAATASHPVLTAAE